MKLTILSVCLLAFLFTFSTQTFAATYVVTTFTDPDNTQGACAAGGGCTLRQAINTANAVAGDDVINFAAGLSGQTILLTPALGQLSITSNITIDALAVANVSVSGGGAVRVFDIQAVGATVVMTGFRVTGGNSNGQGGGIQNIGNLTLNNMVVQANTAGQLGGGIYTTGVGNRLTINGGSILGNNGQSFGGGIYGDSGGIINLTNVTVSGNFASFGGGIRAGGSTLNINGGSVTGNTATSGECGGILSNNTILTVTNASITNNHADGPTSSFAGGIGIFGGSLTITNSTVSGNTARRFSGGIYFGGGGPHSITSTTLSNNSAGSGFISEFSGGGGLVNFSATVNISNSTVSGNRSGCDCGGGGIITIGAGGTTNLRNVTVANNIASNGPGGGIISIVGTNTPGTVNIGNTIVADNTATSNPDVNGAIVSQGFNLVRSRGTSTGYVASDLPDGSNPMLDVLANYGGPTQTHRLLAGSAAIDKGSNALAVNPSNNMPLTTDQRGAGFARIVDGDGNGTAIVDIGAFEVQIAPTAATVSVSGRVTARGRGISSAVVHLTSQSGEILTSRTNRLGYYTFSELAVGETYIFNVFSKRYQFNPQVVNLTENLDELNFTAQ
jgi:CSLREA domain-containing protein